MKLITGNTYPIRERLKALGGRWEPETKKTNMNNLYRVSITQVREVVVSASDKFEARRLALLRFPRHGEISIESKVQETLALPFDRNVIIKAKQDGNYTSNLY